MGQFPGESETTLARSDIKPNQTFERTPVMALERISENEAHLWYGQPDSVSDPGVLRRYRTLLSADECEKLDRYRFAKDRHVGLLTRAMVRCLLSRYVDVAPSRWRFRTNRYGRPEIATPKRASTLRFNVSHTTGMIVVLISKNRDVGVDVEGLPYLGPCLEIADRFFSPAEVTALRSLPAPEQPLRFIEHWVLKESFIKARGMGLSLPLEDFSFRIPRRPEENIEIRFDPSLEDDPERWQFSLEAIGDKHVVATAIERRLDEKIQLVRREALPLVDLPPSCHLAASRS